MKKILLMAAWMTLLYTAARAQSAGAWMAYMAYHDITQIEKAGNTYYVLASNNLYSYNTSDQSVQTYDKTGLLSQCDITQIAYSQAARRLVIVYSNYIIDLLSDQGDVLTVTDYANKNLTVDKTVNSLQVQGSHAYISTGFGIIKLDASQGVFSDTYNLGFGVNYSYQKDGYLYAASEQRGLYRAALNANLADKNNWTRVGDYTPRNTDVAPELLEKVKGANPGGPKYNHFGFLRFANGRLYSCGGVTQANFDEGIPGTIQVLSGDNWQIYEDGLEAKTGDKYVDLAAIDVDPANASHVFAGGRTGIYEFNNGVFVRQYNIHNSPLKPARIVGDGNREYVLAQTLRFDDAGNLWTLNSQSPSTSILELPKDGNWEDHHHQKLMINSQQSLENMRAIMFDSRKLMWFVNEHWDHPGLYCYQPSTEALNVYTSFVNQDGTTYTLTYTHCVEEDTQGNIWVGTNLGPFMLPADQITASSPVFTQVKVPRNDGSNYADYLLSGVDVVCMAIDKANRKWFGTAGNGVYLIDEDNITQLYHFTSDNSKLLSDNIQAVAVDELTGKVYFGTDKGLCSYNAGKPNTTGEMTKDNVYAYPNPVRPDYTGLITITGLTAKAYVKIVTSNGVLVNEGRSSGGNYQWNGTDLKGKRVASGVYMVQVSTQDGEKGTVCKIAIVR